MHREHDQPPVRWPWTAVLLVGAVIGALEAVGIIGVAWIADPTVTEPIVTEHDWWPPDSALLILVALFAVPAGFVVGMGVAGGVHALSRVIDDTLGLTAAGLTAGLLTASVGFFAGLPIASIVEAPSFTMPFVTVAAGLAGLFFSVLALGIATSETPAPHGST